jgi:hypothetical protein
LRRSINVLHAFRDVCGARNVNYATTVRAREIGQQDKSLAAHFAVQIVPCNKKLGTNLGCRLRASFCWRTKSMN